MATNTTDLPDTSTMPSNGASRPISLSTTGTLFWRIFVPVFSTVIITGFLIAMLAIPEEELYLPFKALWARIGIAVIWMLWIYFMYRTLWRLKRVDSDGAHLFVTDYWTTVRYPWTEVTQCSESTHLGRRIAHIHLKAPGRFGQKISFLPASHFKQWLNDHGFGSLNAN